MRVSHRVFLLAFAFCASAFAQDWPARPVTLVVGSAAGSGIDSAARFLADGLRERSGQPFVVENKAGAAGNIGSQAVAHAAPNGYTVLFGSTATHVFNPLMFRNAGYDPVKDFQPVTTLLAIGSVLIVSRDLPVRSVSELSAYLKANPGKLAYASGNGSGRLRAEWYRQIVGFDAVHVPYKSVPQAINDMLGGRIQFMFADISLGIPTAQAGKVRALAITNPRRVANAPDVPTMVEAGVPGFVDWGWLALFYPAGTPMDITRRLADLSNAVMSTAKARDFLRGLGAEPLPGSPESLAKAVLEETARWQPIIRKAGIKAE